MITLDKRLDAIEAGLSMLVYDQSTLVTDDELVDARKEIFEPIEQIQRDIAATEEQLDTFESIIDNANA